MTSPLPRLFVVGDSISVQYGPYLRDMLQGKFEYDRKGGAAALLVDPFQPNDSANGGDSSMVLTYLKERHATDPIRADYMLINCGLHDIKRVPPHLPYQVPIEDYRSNLRAIVSEVRRAGAKMIWARTTPVDDERHNTRSKQFHRFASDADAYNAAADAIMGEESVPMIDLHGFTRSLGSDLYCDHVHFHDPIRQLQAAYIAGWFAHLHI